MNLTKLVLAKIKELGATKSAAYFEVSVPTIYSWKSKKNPPGLAAQKVMDELKDLTEIHIDPKAKLNVTMKPILLDEHNGPVNTIYHLRPPTAGQENREVPASTQQVAFMKKVEAQFKNVDEGLKAITNAILRGDARELRFWAMKSTDPDANVPITSGVSPFRNPESGMAVKSAPELIGDAPVPVDMPRDYDWNENPAPNRAPDWNAPVGKIDDKNRDADWNKPAEKD